jgi:6-phosphogluconate dehydrogenase
VQIGFVGLGKMGSQIVAKLLAAGHSVVVTDVDNEAVAKMAQLGATPAKDRADLVSQLSQPVVIWLMIPAQFVQAELEEWLKLLPSGSIVVDGGNSDYRLTLQRAPLAEARGVSLIDAGTSGGILGLANGFSIMVGGPADKVEQIKPILDVLAQPHGAFHHFGPTGSGHYVKMIHNGIEYGLMQAYAEGYHLLAEGPIKQIDPVAAAEVWQHGSIIASNLNQLIEDIYKANPTLDGIDGFVAESGEGDWTKETAVSANIPTPGLDVALQTRLESQQGKVNHATKLLAAMRHAFGGHKINKDE